MNYQFSSWRLRGAAVLSALVALAGCSGGGDQSGIEGTGSPAKVESIGSVTAYSSVIVNGVRFDIGAANIEINGQAGGFEEDIQLGMVVQIEAELEPGAREGRAQKVVYDRQLRGVIDEISTLDITRKRLTVLEQQVDVADDIVFANLSFESLAVGTAVEVSGFTETEGRIVATRLSRAETSEVDLEGRITSLDKDHQRFTFGSLVVDYTNAVFFGGESDQLQVGMLVEIKGGARGAQGVFVPRQIHLGVEQMSASVQLLLREGVVGQFNGLNDFRLGNLRLDASAAEISGGVPEDIGSGVHLAAEGKMQNDVLQVEQLRLLFPGFTRIRGMVDAVAPDQSELTLLGNLYKVTPFTGYEDRSSVANRFINLSAISVGDAVEIFARYVEGELTATRIRRLEPGGQDDGVTLRGPVTGVDAEGLFSVMGISVDARNAGGANLTADLRNGDLVEVEGRMTGSRSMLAERVSVAEGHSCPKIGAPNDSDESCAPNLPAAANESGNGSGQRAF